MALEALKKITEIKNIEISQIDKTENFIPKTKWLIFYIDGKKYSVMESKVQNILKSVTLYDFPFSPIFVEGVINFHNKIYSVINYKKMINAFDENSDCTFYLILKNARDDFALRISSIKDFYMIPDEDYSDTNDKNSEFIKGFVLLEEEKIPVLDVEAINQNIIDFCAKGETL